MICLLTLPAQDADDALFQGSGQSAHDGVRKHVHAADIITLAVASASNFQDAAASSSLVIALSAKPFYCCEASKTTIKILAAQRYFRIWRETIMPWQQAGVSRSIRSKNDGRVTLKKAVLFS